MHFNAAVGATVPGLEDINPPELRIAEREIQRVPHGRFVMLPADLEGHGHGSHTWAARWQQHLAALLAESVPH